jgi:hypothetical protein
LAILALDARTAWQMESRRIVLETDHAAVLSLDLGMEDLSASGEATPIRKSAGAALPSPGARGGTPVCFLCAGSFPHASFPW